MQPRLPPGHLSRPKSGFGLPVHSLAHAASARVLHEAVERLRARGCPAALGGAGVPPRLSLLVLDRWFSAFA